MIIKAWFPLRIPNDSSSEITYRIEFINLENLLMKYHPVKMTNMWSEPTSWHNSVRMWELTSKWNSVTLVTLETSKLNAISGSYYYLALTPSLVTPKDTSQNEARNQNQQLKKTRNQRKSRPPFHFEVSPSPRAISQIVKSDSFVLDVYPNPYPKLVLEYF